MIGRYRVTSAAEAILMICIAGILTTLVAIGLYVYNHKDRKPNSTSVPGQHNVWLHVDASCVATSTTDANGIEQLSYIQCGGHKK